MLLATAVYTFLRLLEDHEAAPFRNLRQLEIEFCSSLLRERVWSNKKITQILHQTATTPVNNITIVTYTVSYIFGSLKLVCYLSLDMKQSHLTSLLFTYCSS